MRALVLIVNGALLIATYLWMAGAIEAHASETTAAPVQAGCMVDLSVSLAASANVRFDELVAVVDKDCHVSTARNRPEVGPTMGGKLASPLFAGSTNCRSINRMWDNLGLADLTRFTTTFSFTWDGAYVQSASRTFDTYAAPGSPYTTGTVFDNGHDFPPVWDSFTDWQTDYYWWFQYDHTKENYAHAYGDGTCGTSFSHRGFVCSTCSVIFRLEYY